MKTVTIELTKAEVVLLDDLLPLGKESAESLESDDGSPLPSCIEEAEYRQLFSKVKKASLDAQYS